MQQFNDPNAENYNLPDLDDLLDDFEMPEQLSPKPVPLTHEQRSALVLRAMPKILKSRRQTIKLKQKLKRQKQREWDKFIQKMQDYSEDSFNFDRPAREEDRDNPYNYGSRPSSRAVDPADITPAAQEFKGIVDLFDPKLFPAQNSKKYSDKSGREFLADFTKATRGQLVVSMSRLAKSNPIQFAKLWIEMEKFNTPQQAAVDVNADINMRSALYAKLDAMSGPMSPDDDTQSVPQELDEYGNPIPTDDYPDDTPADFADDPVADTAPIDDYPDADVELPDEPIDDTPNETDETEQPNNTETI